MSRKIWSKERILSEIVKLHKMRIDLRGGYIEKHHIPLYLASRRIFGSWKNAVDATGLNYSDFVKIRRNYWTKELIMEKIQELHKEGVVLRSGYIQKNYKPLYMAAIKRFGSWKNAVSNTGLNYLDFVRVKIDYWTDELVIEKIQELHARRDPLNYKNVREKNLNDLYIQARRRFGSWDNALKIAGLDPLSIRKTIPRRFFSNEKIITEIKKLYDSGQSLNPATMEKNYRRLISAARTNFGSWKRAIEAAGLDYGKVIVVERWDKDKILKKIKDLHKQGYSLSMNEIQKSNHSLLSAAIYHFGNWAKAVISSDIDYFKDITQKKIGYWTKDKVVEEILNLKYSGEDLSIQTIMHKYSDLGHAAIRLFGSWENAIISAGLDYEKIRLDLRTESYKGRVFEKYVEKILKIVGKKMRIRRKVDFEDEGCIPDFIDLDTGHWIDAKLNSWSGGIEKSAKRYLKYTDKLIIYYLIGEPRKEYQSKVIFKSIKDFYPQLKELGQEDIIKDLTLLERGVIPSKYQKGLEEFLSREN